METARRLPKMNMGLQFDVSRKADSNRRRTIMYPSNELESSIQQQGESVMQGNQPIEATLAELDQTVNQNSLSAMKKMQDKTKFQKARFGVKIFLEP